MIGEMRTTRGRRSRWAWFSLCGASLFVSAGCRAKAPVAAPEDTRADTTPAPRAEPAIVAESPDPSPVIPSPLPPRRVATGGIYNCAVQSGQVFCWGLDRNHPPNEAFVVENVADAVEVAAGYEAACARTEGGEVVCWDESASWRIEGVSRAISVAVGQSFACAAQPEGVKCWSATLAKDEAPVARDVHGVTDPIQVAAGFYHACALERAGAVKCWGRDTFGALGANDGKTPNFDQGTANDHDWVAQRFDSRDADLDFETFWKQAKGLERSLLACAGRVGGGTTSRAIDFDLRLDAEGAVDDVVPVGSELGEHATAAMNRCVTQAYFADAPRIKPKNGRPTTIGLTLLIQSRGDALRQAHPVLEGAVALASRGYFTCAVIGDGSLQCWGITHGFDGPGVHGTRLESPGTPGTIEGVSGLETISIGWRHACGRRRDGSHVCFGANGEGTFGADIPIGTDFVVRDVDAAKTYAEISAGPTLSCGIRSDASVWCWGINDGGRLGIGHAKGGIQPPAPVVGLPVPR
jgi:hypothetical protein